MSMTALSPSLDYQEGKTEQSVITELINNAAASMSPRVCLIVMRSELGALTWRLLGISMNKEWRVES